MSREEIVREIDRINQLRFSMAMEDYWPQDYYEIDRLALPVPEKLNELSFIILKLQSLNASELLK